MSWPQTFMWELAWVPLQFYRQRNSPDFSSRSPVGQASLILRLTRCPISDTEERSIDPTPILPASCLVAPVVWEVDAEIERVLRLEPAPQCPAGVQYVPLGVRDCLTRWAHTLPSLGHPGIDRTVRSLVAHFGQEREVLSLLLLSVRSEQGSSTAA
jgi:hypothetical protein